MLGEQHRKRRLKDEKRIPLNLRTAPVIRQQLEAAAASGTIQTDGTG